MKEDFNGRLGGANYDDFFVKAVPYWNNLQIQIGRALTKECAKKGRDSCIDVIEIGCGTGATTEQILPADPRIKVAALDISKPMIEQTQKKLGSYVKQGKLSLVHADALDYLSDWRNVCDNSIDYFVSASTIHNIPRKQRALLHKLVYRVLKFGGVFINGDKIAQDDQSEHNKALIYELSCLKKIDEMGRPDLRLAWESHYRRDNQKRFIVKEGEYMKDLKDAGFCNVQKLYRKHMAAIVSGVKPWLH